MERRIGKLGSRVVTGICVLGSLYYMYTVPYGFVTEMTRVGPLVGISLILAFLEKPFIKNRPGGWVLFVDLLLVALSLACIGWLIFIDYRPRHAIEATTFDIAVGGLMIILVLEATRRVVGWVLVFLGLAMLAFTYFGRYMPGILSNPGFSIQRIITVNAVSTMGMWGQAVSVSATIIVMFIIFSAFLAHTGALTFFVDFANAFVGKYKGGPAKAAVVGSTLFGTISGSVVANVTAIGTFSIPLMKRTGYRPTFAAAVEAMASTGGQIMPPVMGATAFLIAEYLNISYWRVCVAAFLPATLYYVSLFFAVHFEAAKTGLEGLPADQLPSARKALKNGWPLVVPLVILIYTLAVWQWSAGKSAFVSTVALIIVSMLSKATRIGPRGITAALNEGMRGMSMITIVCALAGLVIGCINLTGISLSLTDALIKLAGGNMLVLLLLVAAIATIAGMGLPTVAVYIFVVTLMGPALASLGMPPLTAHLFVFWYGCLSAITPPVCIGVFAASAIAGTEPMKTGWVTWRLGLVTFMLPFFFAFNPSLLLQGGVGEVIVAVITSTIGIIAFAGMIAGFLFTRARAWERVLLGVGGLGLIWPSLPTYIGGFVMVGLAVISQVMRKRSDKPMVGET